MYVVMKHSFLVCNVIIPFATFLQEHTCHPFLPEHSFLVWAVYSSTYYLQEHSFIFLSYILAYLSFFSYINITIFLYYRSISFFLSYISIPSFIHFKRFIPYLPSWAWHTFFPTKNIFLFLSFLHEHSLLLFRYGLYFLLFLFACLCLML